MKKLLPLLIAILVAGCSSSKVASEKPPKHMDRVQFVSYDNVQRQMTPSIEVLDRQPDRKYKVIALITCEGAYHEEVVMRRAIIFKARELGADAVIRLDSSNTRTGSGSMYGGSTVGRSLFRANAIVFEQP